VTARGRKLEENDVDSGGCGLHSLACECLEVN